MNSSSIVASAAPLPSPRYRTSSPAAQAGLSPNGNGPETAEDAEATGEHRVGPLTVTGDGPLVVREKTHQAAPMTLDQALYEMELVGHDFYLFVDKDSDLPWKSILLGVAIGAVSYGLSTALDGGVPQH